MRRFNKLLIILFFAGIFFIAGCSSKESPTPRGTPTGDVVSDAISDEKQVIIYKSSTCGCCSAYASYMKKKGFDVKVIDMQDLTSIKDKYGIPYILQSCHTSIIDNYFIEGHIPVEAINKLLAEKPDIMGIAMPGMPSASPGMPGAKASDFVISAVNKDGNYPEFMRM